METSWTIKNRLNSRCIQDLLYRANRLYRDGLNIAKNQGKYQDYKKKKS